MSSTTATAPARTEPVPVAARAALRALQSLQAGSLELHTPQGQRLHFGGGAGPRAMLQLADWSVCSAALRRGDVGFAERYIEGSWATPELVPLLRLLLRNREAVGAMVYGRWWATLADRLRHLLHRNTRRGSRRNIHAHYDLGNTFYRLWLDETFNYSSAWFEGDLNRPLPVAQRAKVRRALQQSGIGANGRLLEVGCGWGALAEMAAAEFGARVTGLTLSSEQLQFGRQRLAAAGLQERAELRLQDYRDVTDAPFDAIVSIEMFEAVGRAFWGDYFAALRRLLRPGGRACIQSITIRDDLFERYVRGTDFIQQYIFPGGLLPSPAAFRAEAARAGFEVVDELAFGADYAETLRRWRARFGAEEEAVRALGFDTRFVRTWDFYLAYCEAAFAEGSTDVMQFTLVRGA